MYKWSKSVCCPIIHFALLQDLLRNYQDTEIFTEEINDILDLAFKNNPTVLFQKDPVCGDTLLLSALEGGLFEVVKKIGEMVTQYETENEMYF